MAPSSFASPLVAAAALYQRDITGSISNAKTTLSSWDNCMANQYCKWPVIVAIIIASLIVLSFVVCIGRCLCCGLECCCGCFACCNACCPSPRGRRSAPQKEYISAPQQGPWNPQQQYQPQGPMGYGGGGGFFNSGAPQYAQFDASTTPKASAGPAGRITEDSLPAMPSWQNATTRRVEDPDYKEDDVELEKLPSPSPPLEAPLAASHMQQQQQQQQQQHRPTSDEARQPMLAPSPYGEDFPSPSSATAQRNNNFPFAADPSNPYAHDYTAGAGAAAAAGGDVHNYNRHGPRSPYAADYPADYPAAGGAGSYGTASPPPPSLPPSYATRAPTFPRDGAPAPAGRYASPSPYAPRPPPPPQSYSYGSAHSYGGSGGGSGMRSPVYGPRGTGNPYYEPRTDAGGEGGGYGSAAFDDGNAGTEPAHTAMPEATRYGGQRMSAGPPDRFGGGGGGGGLPGSLVVGQQQGGAGPGMQRKPVNGSWRDV